MTCGGSHAPGCALAHEVPARSLNGPVRELPSLASTVFYRPDRPRILDCDRHIFADGHIRNTPKRVSRGGAYAAHSSPIASTWRVSSGSITPSSQSRAVE